MRLLQLQDDGEFSLVEFVGNNIPRYAILSHTWGADHEEVSFKDLIQGTGKIKTGYRKLVFCGKHAAADGLQFFWVDTCCIDKSSSAELSEAINSMFLWYQNAARCYVYLLDVLSGGSVEDDEFPRRWKSAFKKSRWFTRGWTLQELLAPESVEFFSMDGQRLGDKQSLEETLHDITGIAIKALRGSRMCQFSVHERMLWAEKRRTTREEDAVYSLLGIFNINMSPIYGEGREKALIRLQKRIKDTLKDDLLSLNEERKRMLLDLWNLDQVNARQTSTISRVQPFLGTHDLDVPTLSVVKIPDGDTFIFYYETGSRISYCKKSKEFGSYSAHRVQVGDAYTEAIGSNSPLAAVVYKGLGKEETYDLRLYYIASDSTINELWLPDVSKNEWTRVPHINGKIWKASRKSGLLALGVQDLGEGNIELYFMDQENGDKMTRAWSFAPEFWKKEEIA